MERPQLLLAEYSEACQACRAHEQNSRSALNFFLAFGGALLALAFTSAITNAGRVGLLFLGFAVGLFFLNTIFRHRAYYAAYIRRAKEIEKELDMVLYTRAWDEVRGSKIFSNKHAIAGVIGVFSLFFLAAAFVLAFRGQQWQICALTSGCIGPATAALRLPLRAAEPGRWASLASVMPGANVCRTVGLRR